MSIQPPETRPASTLPAMPFAGGLGDAMDLIVSLQLLWWSAAAKAQTQRASFLTRRCEAASRLPLALAERCPAGEALAIGQDYVEAVVVDYVDELARCAEAHALVAAESAARMRASVRTLSRDRAAQTVCP
ncbi:hypothetical protein [Aureimonas glaciei]|uniref:Uncharacterized protein n=1 Tax=Aureimonas glaciei TaxID=1776957 RepID=A0A916XXL6_9HYPH|nr:hypothetical protein [Aureimonas glaciei]GGD20323.1 hypothetical protein GCM10011335_24060 [Aureimonas glaciei]